MNRRTLLAWLALVTILAGRLPTPASGEEFKPPVSVQADPGTVNGPASNLLGRDGATVTLAEVDPTNIVDGQALLTPNEEYEANWKRYPGSTCPGRRGTEAPGPLDRALSPSPCQPLYAPRSMNRIGTGRALFGGALGMPSHGRTENDMKPWKPYSKRKAETEREPTTVFEFEQMPETFRVSLAYTLNAAMGLYTDPDEPKDMTAKFETHVQRELARYHGRTELEAYSFLVTMRTEDYLIVLDAIEIALRVLHSGLKKNWLDADSYRKVVEQINDLFAEYGLGYQVQETEVLRVDTPALTENAVKPALTLLADPAFAQVEEEFRKAMESHRGNQPGEAIAWANAAFESTMKVVLRERKVPFNDGDTAKPLIAKVVAIPSLIPSHLTNYANNLTEVFQALPTARNKAPPAHGAGTNPPKVTRDDASFAVNLAATFIVFLAGRHRALPKPTQPPQRM